MEDLSVQGVLERPYRIGITREKEMKYIYHIHCIKYVRIRVFSNPFFPYKDGQL